MHKISIIISAYLLLCSSIYANGTKLEISDVWISEAPPNVRILAAYGKIRNPFSEPVKLHSLSSPDFSSIEIHLSKQVNDMATMEKRDVLTIPANAEIVLKQGSYHFMLFDPIKPLKAGDTTTIRFNFSNDQSTLVEAIVKKREIENHHHHH